MGANVRYLHGTDPKSSLQQNKTVPPKEHAVPAILPKPAELILQYVKGVFRALLETFVAKSDDTLFQMSKNASFDQDQHTYFSALRCLRLNKVLLTQRFEKEYQHVFVEFFSQPLPDDATSKMDWTIVDKELLEIDLAGEMMSKRVKQSCEGEILNLHSRLESIGAYSSRRSMMPFEPMCITQVFKQVLQNFEFDTKSKLVLLKEFERNVLKHLPEIILSLNQQLIKMGILPTVNMRPDQHQKQRPQMGSGSAKESTASTINMTASTMNTTAPAAGMQNSSSMQNGQSLYQKFEQWLTEQQPALGLGLRSAMFSQANPAAGERSGVYAEFSGLIAPDSGQGVRLESTQLTSLLTGLQHQILQNRSQLTPSFLEEAIHQPRGLMSYVHQHLHRNFHNGYQLAKREQNILLLLTKVFSQVLEQESLPKLVRYALWSLQVPYLKVAMQDTYFFLDTHHPARQLLNLLAEASLHIDLKQETQDPLLDQIDAITKRVLHEYDQDISLFETLIAEFRGFLELHKRRMDLLHQRMVAAEEGKARRELAEKEVDHCLQRLLTAEVPENVCDFAKKWWWKVLFYLYLKEGQQSGAWRRAQHCLETLIHTVLPKKTSIDVEIAKQGLSDLIQQLREGLLWVGCEEEEIKHIIKNLRLFHSVGSIRKKSDIPSNLTPDVFTDTMSDMSGQSKSIPVEEEIFQSADPTATTTPVIETETETETEAASSFSVDSPVRFNPAILVGEWIEYIKAPDEVIRCQLAMHLPSCDKMIFINRIGMKVLECTGNEFRNKLHTGECRKLQQSALFDQALRQVIELMQSENSKNWKFA